MGCVSGVSGAIALRRRILRHLLHAFHNVVVDHRQKGYNEGETRIDTLVVLGNANVLLHLRPFLNSTARLCVVCSFGGVRGECVGNLR